MYLWAFGMIATVIEFTFSDAAKLYQLASLAGLAFVATALAAWIISITNAKKKIEPRATQPAQKTDAELRAEIEEKIRSEMIEKEVRAGIEAERAHANGTTPNITDSGSGDDRENS